MKSKKILTKVLFLCLILLFPISCFASSSISFNSSWKYASESKIHSGSATLYEATSNSNGYTVAVNAGHGTRGGTSKANNTYSHPDHTPKIKGGTNPAGAVFSAAVSSGMTFKDGTTEATVTLQMAKIVKDKLLDNGYNVLMIRESEDVQLDNIARTVIANNNADIHVSLHWDGDGDSINYDKGVFFMSVANDAGYRNMEPVKSMYQKHDELGRTIIKTMKNDGIKIFGNGEMENDLTQTSYSTIPSIDIEFGNQYSKHDDATLDALADSFVHGIAEYFNTSYTPSKKNGSSTISSDGAIDLDKYSLRSEDKSLLESAMKSWPSEIETGRIAILDKGLSLINIGIHYPSTKHPAADHCTIGHYDVNQPKRGDGMDCSDYVSWAYYAGGAKDVSPDYCTNDFASSSLFTTISEADLLPGDIALKQMGNGCTDTSSASGNHVGIYFGKANGQNIFIHSTSGATITGPQVRKGNGSFTIFRRYKNYSSEMTSVDSSSGSSGLSGNIPTGLQDDPYEDNGFGYTETKDITCKNIFMKEDGSDELNDLGEAVQGLFTLIKIATPIIVLILTTIDYIKAMTNQDDAEIKKATPRTFKRLIFGILIFLLPFLLDLIFHLLGLYDLSTCGIGVRAG